jgi:2-phospho-L-lactate guanylyltransferase
LVVCTSDVKSPPVRSVLVPIRSFDRAKMRLAPALGESARAGLVRKLAARVVAAAAPMPVAVVCEDESVARFAADLGADVLLVSPGLGLSGSVAAGVDRLASEGIDVVTVAHGDLAMVVELSSAGRDAGEGGEGEVTIAPDRRLDGTNVITVPTRRGFRFAYGPGSFERHRAEAARIGLACRIMYDWNLALDVDLPDDLDVAARAGRPVDLERTEG